jgi:cytochrome d ubiquinol oxidase subunit I
VDKARDVYRPAVVLGVIVMFVAGVGVALTGDQQAKLMFQQQPMKMSSAEALCETVDGASFSLLAIGDLSNSCEGVTHVIEIPGLTSFLATGDWNAPLPGVQDLQKQYEEKYGFTDDAGNPISYQPNLAITYWSFRLMIGFGIGSAALAVFAFWVTRRGRVSGNKWIGRLAIAALATPFLASSFGWIFTEMGRQPWVVAPNPSGVDGVWLLTQRGVSTVVGAGTVATSLIAFTLLYGILAVFWYRLMHRYTIEGVADSERDYSPDNPDNHIDPDEAARPLSFAY